MKQKFIIGIMVLLLVTVIVFMARDLFMPSQQTSNPYTYDINEFKKIDSSKRCYVEYTRLSPNIENIRGIAIDTDDMIYLVGDNKLAIYDHALVLQTEFEIGTQAMNLSVSPDGIIYLGAYNHIELWNTKGEKIDTWPSYNNKSVITSLAIKDSTIYVADAGNKLVLKYKLTGDLIGELGRKDSTKNHKGFFIPSPYFDVAIGRQGELWAVNSGYHKLEAYNEQDELFSSWKRTSMQWDGFSGCCNPSHIALLSDGSFVTSEKGIVRIKVHSQSGEFICAVATPDEFKLGTRGLDLAIDSEDRIYALVPNDNEVRIYTKKES